MVDLSAAIARGDFRPGDQITSVGVLARRYQLSRPTILKALQPMMDDGTLRSVPSVGVFVGHTESTRPGCYLVLVDSRHANQIIATSPTVRAFEERITAHGGHSMALGSDAFLDESVRSALPTILGVFVYTGDQVGDVLATVDESVPVVSYLAGCAPPHALQGSRTTYVDIDNVSGGALATTELLRDGHRNIAFLGTHIDGHPAYPWSAQRAAGWAQTIRRHNPRASLRCFQPSHTSQDPFEVAINVAAGAVDEVLDFSACIGADDTVLMALARRLRESGVTQSRWPTMVGFEGLAEAQDLVTTSIRPRWEDLGIKAANHLFDASRGRPRPAGVIDRAQMTLISRPFVADPTLRLRAPRSLHAQAAPPRTARAQSPALRT
ncbi:substrate-binding domain-containing protein [Microlunatus sp. Y2014]|uniref:substrate-binding domain-containing protein n=1 Tax=Microlunatus sp. Y2014 TaxID=3418488 RepID=UPI003DA6CF36